MSAEREHGMSLDVTYFVLQKGSTWHVAEVTPAGSATLLTTTSGQIRFWKSREAAEKFLATKARSRDRVREAEAAAAAAVPARTRRRRLHRWRPAFAAVRRTGDVATCVLCGAKICYQMGITHYLGVTGRDWEVVDKTPECVEEEWHGRVAGKA